MCPHVKGKGENPGTSVHNLILYLPLVGKAENSLLEVVLTL